MQDEQTIEVLAREPSPPPGALRGALPGFNSPLAEALPRPVQLHTGELKAQLKLLVENVGNVLGEAATLGGSYSLEEVTLTAEITAEGGFTLIGLTHAKAGGSGGVQLKFKRKST